MPVNEMGARLDLADIPNLVESLLSDWLTSVLTLIDQKHYFLPLFALKVLIVVDSRLT